MKANLILIMSILLLFGCEDKYDETPEWVNDILARTVNNDDLVGSWTYTSITFYDNGDCGGSGKAVDYAGTVTYGELEAVRTENVLLYVSDFAEKGYSINEFQEMCAEKEGGINEDGDCEIGNEFSFEYYLTDGGYCEVLSFADKDDDQTYEKTYCGDITIADNMAEITFNWSSEEWDKSGCKAIVLTEE